MEGSAVGDAFAQAFQPVMLGLANFVAVKAKDALAIITFDGKDLGENGLQSRVFAPRRGDVGLQKIPVGIGLQLDQIGRCNYLLNFSKMDAFS